MSRQNNLIESYFLNIPFDITMQNNLTAPSLDRIDNSKGYEKGNVRIVTRFENMGRRDTPFEEFCNNFEFKK